MTTCRGGGTRVARVGAQRKASAPFAGERARAERVTGPDDVPDRS